MSVRGERGFTLIELMVVVLVVGILMSIAVPTFLGARSRAQDTVAKSSLHLALSVAAAEPSAPINAEGMAKLERSLEFVRARQSSTGPKVLSIAVSDERWAAAALSDSGTCFWVSTDFISKPDEGSRSGDQCSGSDVLPDGGDDGDGRSAVTGGLESPPPGGGGPSGPSYDQAVLGSGSLVAYWRLEPSDGGTAVDSGPYGFNGTYTPAAQVSGAPAVAASWGSLHTGPGAYVNLPLIDVDWSGGLTIAAWVRPEGPGFYDRILELSNGPGADGIWFGRTMNQSRIAFEVRPKGTGVNPIAAPSGSLSDGIWQFQAVTVTPAGSVTLYRNAKILATGQSPTMPVPGARGINFIGRSAWQNEPEFRGLIDEVSVWNRPLAAAELSSIYKAGMTP